MDSLVNSFSEELLATYSRCKSNPLRSRLRRCLVQVLHGHDLARRPRTPPAVLASLDLLEALLPRLP